MDPTWMLILLFICLFAALFAGVPVAFGLGAVSLLFVLVLWGPNGLYVTIASMLDVGMTETYIAIPMFLLLAFSLQISGISDDLYETVYYWLGPLNGGLAMGTIFICALFSAMCGGSGQTVLTMGLIAMPSMLKRGYDRKLVMGTIMAGGILGIVIPPSIPMIMMGVLGQESVGKLYFGGIVPGFFCVIMYVIYIGVRCWINPSLGPAVPPEERIGWLQKVKLLKSVIAPVLLILSILGVMYTGVCTATEASAVGCFGAMLCVIIRGKFNWAFLATSLQKTLQVSVMVAWIMIAAGCFTNVFTYLGGADLIASAAVNMPGGRWAVTAAFMVGILIMGCIMDDYALIIICTPIFFPIMKLLGVDTVWFGIIFVLSIQVAYLTPPYGFNLFYMRALTPKSVTMGEIWLSAVPFVGIQVIALVLVMIFPELATWLPSTLIKVHH